MSLVIPNCSSEKAKMLEKEASAVAKLVIRSDGENLVVSCDANESKCLEVISIIDSFRLRGGENEKD